MLSAEGEAPAQARTHAPDVEVAVIGAGPHGLAAAVHLRRAGVAAHVLGDPMSFWRTMPRGMRLRSNTSATNMIEPHGPLSLAAFGAQIGRPVRAPVELDDFVAYGSWVQSQAVPDVDRRQVVTLARDEHGFELALDDGEQLRARQVVVAAGIAPFEHVPDGYAHLGPDRVSHSARHREPAALRGRRLAIVGGGQSACELAALASEAGAAEVEVLVRAPRMVWLRGHSIHKRLGRLAPVVYAPTDVGPLWYSRLVERPRVFGLLPRRAQDRIAARCIRPACAHFVRVRLDGVRLTYGAHVSSAAPDGAGVALSLSDGTQRLVDEVILATGYRVDVHRYAFLGEDIRRDLRTVRGYPVLDAALQSSVPGLHFVGAPAAWSSGPIMRFVSGSWYAGRTVARALGTGARR